MNTVICTEKGFVKSITFVRSALQFEILFTDKLREARWWNSKTAKSKMEKHELNGWLYNPYAEEPLRDLWRVVPVTKEVNWRKVETGAFTIERYVAFGLTDVRFLNGSERPVGTYSKEEATQFAIQKNLDAITSAERQLLQLGFERLETI